MMLPPIRGLPWPLWSRGEPGLVSPCFFFSSRRRHTRSLCDWSSDVCSSDLTLSLSRTCRCYCKYCAFATHQPHLYSPDEVLEILDRAAQRHRVKELLVLTGEAPEHNSAVAARSEERRVGNECRPRG